jgi:threonine aldolase
MEEKEIQALTKTCVRFLGYGYPQTPKQQLSELASYTDANEDFDRYGEGELITSFEADVAKLLGKEAAVFMPSGTMCQQIALRIWTDRRELPRVAFHPTCHLEIHEQQAYRRLHHLESILVGPASRMLTLDDLKAIAEPIGALLLELPQREIGGQLPSWEELNAIITWAREKHIATHLDGARLWECQPFYEREYAEIAGLFDSVYVSFYKALGGIAGSILAGPADFIAEARIWQRRQGGNLVHLYPFVLAARKGLTERLGKMRAYHEKAKEIANALSSSARIEILPNPPQTNMMHVFVQGDSEQLLDASFQIARETKTLLFTRLNPTIVPHWSRFELTVGDASLDMDKQEIEDLFTRLFALADKNSSPHEKL